jgi:hypothetical protein
MMAGILARIPLALSCLEQNELDFGDWQTITNCLSHQMLRCDSLKQ